MFQGNSPISADQVSTALSVIDTLRSAVDLVSRLEVKDLKAAVAELSKAKAEADASIAASKAKADEVARAADAVALREAAVVSNEIKAGEKLKNAAEMERTAAEVSADLVKEHRAYEARMRDLQDRERQMNTLSEELDDRLKKLKAAEAYVAQAKLDIQARLDAIKAAAAA